MHSIIWCGHQHDAMPVGDTETLGIESNVFHVNSEKWTFQDPTVRRWVEERLEGRVLNACAGNTKLRYDGEIVRNDVNEERDADMHHRVRDLPDHLEANSFDTIVYDPPWSVYQCNDKYEGEMVAESSIMANALDELLKPKGKVLGFGYTIDIMPSSMGYDKTEVAIFTIPGRGKDFFGVVDENNKRELGEWTR